MDDNFMKYWIFVLALIAGPAGAETIKYESTLAQIFDINQGSVGYGSAWYELDRETGAFLSFSAVSEQYSFSLSARSGPMTFTIFDVTPVDYMYGMSAQIALNATNTVAGESFSSGAMANNDGFAPHSISPLDAILDPPSMFFYIYLRDGTHAIDMTIDARVVPGTAAEVPEPTTLALLSLGLAVSACRRKGMQKP